MADDVAGNGILLIRLDERTKEMAGDIGDIKAHIEDIRGLLLLHDRDITRLKENKNVWDKALNGIIAALVAAGMTWLIPHRN